MRKPFHLNMLTLEGQPRKRGQIYGETLREKIHENIEALKTCILQKPGQAGDEALRQYVEGTQHLARANQQAPDLVEEVRGIAEGAGLEFPFVFALQVLEGLGSSGGCSALGVWGQENQPTLLAQTADNPFLWHDHLTLLHVIYPDSDLEIYTMTFSGLVGAYGLNNHGIGVCVNALGELKSGNGGLGVPFVSRRILEQTTLGQVDSLIHSLNFISGNNYVIGSPERVRDYECSANQVCEYIPPEGVSRLFHTNHALVNDDRTDSGRQDPDFETSLPKRMPNSWGRYQTMETLLKNPEEPVAVETIKAVLSTHGEHPICSHHDSPDLGGSITNYTMIMELSETPVLHLAGGPACYSMFWRFKF